MRVFEEVEQEIKAEARHGIVLSTIMQDMWESKGAWFWHSLSSVNAMYITCARTRFHLKPKGFYRGFGRETQRMLFRRSSRTRRPMTLSLSSYFTGHKANHFPPSSPLSPHLLALSSISRSDVVFAKLSFWKRLPRPKPILWPSLRFLFPPTASLYPTED